MDSFLQETERIYGVGACKDQLYLVLASTYHEDSGNGAYSSERICLFRRVRSPCWGPRICCCGCHSSRPGTLNNDHRNSLSRGRGPQDNYEDPYEFKPWRFSEMREKDGESIHHQMVTPRLDYILFGIGRTAW